MVKDVPLIVEGDREALLHCVREQSIPCEKLEHEVWWVVNTFVHFDDGIKNSSVLKIDTKSAKEYQGQPIRPRQGTGTKYLPFEEQNRYFIILKRAVTDSRRKYFKEWELKMKDEEFQHQEQIEKLTGVIDSEADVVTKEHDLHEQIVETLALLQVIRERTPPRAYRTNNRRVDFSRFQPPAEALDHLLDYLAVCRIESVKIKKRAEQVVELVKRETSEGAKALYEEARQKRDDAQMRIIQSRERNEDGRDRAHFIERRESLEVLEMSGHSQKQNMNFIAERLEYVWKCFDAGSSPDDYNTVSQPIRQYLAQRAAELARVYRFYYVQFERLAK